MAERPVIVAYDGSDLAQRALRHAAELFPGRTALVVTVWEPGLALMGGWGAPDPAGSATMGVGALYTDFERVEQVDRAQRHHAQRLAADGTELARSLGMPAEPHVVADEVDIADMLHALARERDAVVIVAGTHGVSGLRAHFLGGVSRKLLSHADRPVLLVRGERD